MTLDQNENDEPRIASARALFVMLGIVLLAFTIILVRLYRVQIRGGEEWTEKSRGNFVQFRRLEHDRGEIVDREGRVLVTNRPSINIELTPAFFPRTSRLVKALANAVALDAKRTASVLAALERSAEERGPPILLERDLSREEVKALHALQESLELPLRALVTIPMPPPSAPDLYAVYLDPQHFPTPARVINRLTDRMDMTAGEVDALKKKIARAQGLDRYLPIVVRRDVSPDLEERVKHEVLLGDVPGVAVRHAKSRHYEFETLAAHLLGYVNELSPQELEEKRELGYRLGDSVGRRGVEKTFEESLRGVDGREAVIVDSKGRPQESSFASTLQSEIGARETPRAGDRVWLTLDLDLQQAAERAFNQTAGSVVVLEVDTGRVLTMTSTPSFNPNLVTGYFDPREKKRLDESRALRPWRFRAIQDYFAPGSTFKVATAIAALSQRVTTEHESIGCRGAYMLGSTRFRCWKESGHGPVDVVGALEKSCDVYFYAMGARLGLDPIAQAAMELGFGQTTGIPLAGESPGIAPTSAWYKKHLPEGYTLGAAVNVSVGQGATTATPIQLAVAYAALANGGTVYEPQVGLRIEPNDGTPAIEIPPKVRRRINIPPRILQLVQEGLRRVVNDPGGTAYKRRLPDIEVSGKTGTAQVAKLGRRGAKLEDIPWHLRDHAWFAAFAPSTRPEIAVVVLSEHGGGGSSAAAPVAMEVISAWHRKRQAKAAASSGPAGAVEGGEPSFAYFADDVPPLAALVEAAGLGEGAPRAEDARGGRSMDRRLIANIDRPLLAVVGLCAGLALYNLASAGRPLGLDLHITQGVHFLVGFLIMALIASFHYRTFEVLAAPFFVLSIVLLVATELVGRTVNGSQRWLPIGPVNVQTADISKLAVVLILARMFHLDRVGPGLTLREVARPMNVSRPLLLVIGVLAVTVLGDAVKPAAIQRIIGKHSRTVATLSSTRPTLIVGRTREADVRLSFEGVSERHAEIVRRGDGDYAVRDLGSSTGTFLNGELIDGEARIKNGDELRFGPSSRTIVTLRAQTQKLRPYLPYLALLGFAWLVASMVHQFRKSTWTVRDLIAPIDVVLIPVALVLMQPDLGTALIITLISLSMILYVGFRPLSLGILAFLGVVLTIFSWFVVLKPYQKDRVLTFLDPTSDLAGAGYHQHQSMIAIGSGGWFGSGHGQGTQTQLSFLPEQQTDFIFSVWAEEHGFVGCTFVVLLFLALILLSIRVVSQARDRFGALLAVGVTAMLFWHSVINMLMVLQLAPVVGVPLPLWSNGGSFAITVLAGVGILLSVRMRRFVF